MRVLSGIQPTGRFHWGNYFGAIRQYIDLQHKAEDAYYFIANLHALTTIRDKDQLWQLTLDAATDLIALGLEPEKATLFVQSDVPEISELCWILMTGTSMGLLERCHAFKDKKAKGLSADAGLFTYPVLQAADILGYDSDTVPVGEDQVQHIEVCRDLAGSFNHQFGEVFTLPKAYVIDTSARVPGTDGEKMSKSYDNTIDLFEEPGPLKKKIMRITTDSRPMEDPKEPESDHLYQLYSLFADEPAKQEMADLYRAGGFGYGQVKKALAELAKDYFAEAREKRKELESKPQIVLDVLADGAAKARKKAGEVLKRAQDACGLEAKPIAKRVSIGEFREKIGNPAPSIGKAKSISTSVKLPRSSNKDAIDRLTEILNQEGSLEKSNANDALIEFVNWYPEHRKIDFKAFIRQSKSSPETPTSPKERE